MTVRPGKIQISLGIRPVWSESSLCAQWVAENPRFLHAVRRLLTYRLWGLAAKMTRIVYRANVSSVRAHSDPTVRMTTAVLSYLASFELGGLESLPMYIISSVSQSGDMLIDSALDKVWQTQYIKTTLVFISTITYSYSLCNYNSFNTKIRH